MWLEDVTVICGKCPLLMRDRVVGARQEYDRAGGWGEVVRLLGSGFVIAGRDYKPWVLLILLLVRDAAWRIRTKVAC